MVKVGQRKCFDQMQRGFAGFQENSIKKGSGAQERGNMFASSSSTVLSVPSPLFISLSSV